MSLGRSLCSLWCRVGLRCWRDDWCGRGSTDPRGVPLGDSRFDVPERDGLWLRLRLRLRRDPDLPLSRRAGLREGDDAKLWASVSGADSVRWEREEERTEREEAWLCEALCETLWEDVRGDVRVRWEEEALEEETREEAPRDVASDTECTLCASELPCTLVAGLRPLWERLERRLGVRQAMGPAALTLMLSSFRCESRWPPI